MAKKDLTQLVIAAQGGDGQALSDLFEESYQSLLHYAAETVKNTDLAEDITQEACLEIMNHLQDLREPKAFVIWARRITYHQCTKHFRETKEVTIDTNEDGESLFDQIVDESEGSLPEQVQLDKEFQATMHALLDELPAHQRTALMMHYYERIPIKQIAEIEDEKEATIKSRLFQGRRAMEAKIEAYEKKTGVRLHSFVPLPLLLAFLFGNRSAEIAQTCAPALERLRQYFSGILAAGGATAAAGAGAAGAGAATGATAAGAGAAAATGAAAGVGTAATGAAAGGAAATAGAAAGLGLGTKIAAGVVAAAVCIGGAVGGNALLKNLIASPQPVPTDPSHRVEAPAEFCGTWYGDRYDDGDLTDYYTLSEDGTLEIGGRTYALNGITDYQESEEEKRYCAETYFLHFSYAGESQDLATENRTDLNLAYNWNNQWNVPAYEVTVYINEPDSHEATINGRSYNRVYSDMLVEHWNFPSDAQLIYGYWYRENGDNIDTSDALFLNEEGILSYNGQTYYLSYIKPNYSVRETQTTFLGFTLSYSLNPDLHHKWVDSSVDMTIITSWHDEENLIPRLDVYLPQPSVTVPTASYIHQSVLHGEPFLPLLPGETQDNAPTEETWVPSEGLTFSEYGDGYAVTGIGECTDAHIVIPAEYMGKPVTRIADWAFEHEQGIISITIPDSVTYIGNRAFWGIETLESIRLPKNLMILEEYVLWDCTALKEIHIPDSVYRIEQFAFSGCNSLTNVTIPESVTSIGTGAFYQCASLSEVYLPIGLKTLAYSAFFECPALKEVTFAGTTAQLLALDTRETSFEFQALSAVSHDYAKVDWDITNHVYACSDGTVAYQELYPR